MYDDILAEMEARGMFKEAKESKQNPWRDGVLGAAGGAAGLGAGAAAGAGLGVGRHKKDLQQARRLADHAKTRFEQLNTAAAQNRKAKSRGRVGKMNASAWRARYHSKGFERAVEEAAKRIAPAMRSGGKGLLAGGALGAAAGLAAGVAASRFAGREKKASSQDEIEQAILFAAFEDELEKISERDYSMIGQHGKGPAELPDLTVGYDSRSEAVGKRLAGRSTGKARKPMTRMQKMLMAIGKRR
jgi:hypothetical protein